MGPVKEKENNFLGKALNYYLEKAKWSQKIVMDIRWNE